MSATVTGGMSDITCPSPCTTLTGSTPLTHIHLLAIEALSSNSFVFVALLTDFKPANYSLQYTPNL